MDTILVERDWIAGGRGGGEGGGGRQERQSTVTTSQTMAGPQWQRTERGECLEGVTAEGSVFLEFLLWYRILEINLGIPSMAKEPKKIVTPKPQSEDVLRAIELGDAQKPNGWVVSRGSSDQGTLLNTKVLVAQDLEWPSLKELLADEWRRVLEAELQSQPQGVPMEVPLASESLPTLCP